MNNLNNPNIDNSIIRTQTRQTDKTSLQTEGTISKKELGALAKEGTPSKVVNQNEDSTSALIKKGSRNRSKSIKKAFISFFDTSLSDSKKIDSKANGNSNEKIIHEKQVKAFFKEFNPECTNEGGRVINEPEYIKKTLDTLFSIIDEASKFPTKQERQACLAKFMEIVHSEEFSAKLGPVTMENMLTAASAYRNKVITD